MFHSNNPYQIYVYVKNDGKKHTGKVSGLLLYATTTEDVPPLKDALIGRNRFSARELDLNRSFREISEMFDRIVDDKFGGVCIKIA